jgi:hypothetical protein
MEARDDLQAVLLNGLPTEEREYVINKIAEVNDAKRRHLRAMTEPDEVESHWIPASKPTGNSSSGSR